MHRRRWLGAAGLVATSSLAFGFLPAAQIASAGVGARGTVSPGSCGTSPDTSSATGVLLQGSAWLNGDGVDVMSNGSDEGTGASCAPKTTETIKGVQIPKGYEWQCTELVNRLYLDMGWIHALWKGNGGDSSSTAKDSMYYTMPSGLTRSPEGSITYLAPGDTVFINEYKMVKENKKEVEEFLSDGHVLVVDTTGTVTSGAAKLVSQNSGSPSGADPVNNIVPKLSGGDLTFTSPKGDAYTYETIGVVHAPSSTPPPPPPPPHLLGVKQVVSDFDGNCALLTAGGVDCWGTGIYGNLGDGKFISSPVPVGVLSTTGKGALSGVVNLVSNSDTFCALLGTRSVACWGFGSEGELGDGKFYTSNHHGSSIPVRVLSLDGKRALSSVARVTGGLNGFCAVLKSGKVDCWGYGPSGQLGNGKFYRSGLFPHLRGTNKHSLRRDPSELPLASSHVGSSIPVQVVSTKGSGALSGVTSLASVGDGYCALIKPGSVDCWGDGGDGELGDGKFFSSGHQGSAIPVRVVSPSGSSTLTGVTSITAATADPSYCARLVSGGVDCWGTYGLGVARLIESAIPVKVASTGGSGTISGVVEIVSAGAGYCVLTGVGGVDCWGDGNYIYGELGDGSQAASATPVAVVSTGGSGALSGVVSLSADSQLSYCALLASGTVDCWGNGYSGELGNGQYYTATFGVGSAVPVQVVSTSGSGALTSVQSVAGYAGGAGYADPGEGSYCAVLTSGSVDCWGYGDDGRLGGGAFTGTATPVEVK